MTMITKEQRGELVLVWANQGWPALWERLDAMLAPNEVPDTRRRMKLGDLSGPLGHPETTGCKELGCTPVEVSA